MRPSALGTRTTTQRNALSFTTYPTLELMPMPRKKRTRRLWTAADVKVLKSLAGRKSLGAIARILKRTSQATRRKATTRGISLAMK